MSSDNLICVHCVTSSIKNSVCENCKRYVSPDNINIGDKVLYSPSRSVMKREISDEAYDCFGFYPGDVYTVKGFTKENELDAVLVNENDFAWIVHFLIPEKEIRKEVIDEILDEYNELLEKYRASPVLDFFHRLLFGEKRLKQ